MGALQTDVDKLNNGGPLVAAITLGSNSFNMLLAQADGALPVVVAKHKRKVRLAKGLSGGALDAEVSQQALQCLAWFGEILTQQQPQKVAVYATAALRQANDAGHFCQQALPLLGYPIEIISGEREAELIFHGMRATTPTKGQVAMIDIGGASTELVIGDRNIDYKYSFPLGAVLYSNRYFSAGINAVAFRRAETALRSLLQPQLSAIQCCQWQRSLGISGTFRSLFELAHNRGLDDAYISRNWLQQLQREMIELGRADLAGLEPERAPTFAAGVAILLALMDMLNIDAIFPAGGALREGVLAELGGISS